jgi:hypothetical protein
MDRKQDRYGSAAHSAEFGLKNAPWRVDGSNIERAMTEAFRIELLALSRPEQLRCLAVAGRWLKRHPDQTLESFEAIGFSPAIRKRVVKRLEVSSLVSEGELAPAQVVDVEFTEPDGKVVVVHMAEAALRQFDRLGNLQLKREIYGKMCKMTEQDPDLVIRILPTITSSSTSAMPEKPKLSIFPKGLKQRVGLKISDVDDSDVADFRAALEAYNMRVRGGNKDEQEIGSV